MSLVCIAGRTVCRDCMIYWMCCAAQWFWPPLHGFWVASLCVGCQPGCAAASAPWHLHAYFVCFPETTCYDVPIVRQRMSDVAPTRLPLRLGTGGFPCM